MAMRMAGPRAGWRPLALLGVAALVLALVPAGAGAQEVAWARQFGTAAYDVATGAAAGPDGVYVVGFTDGVLPGQMGNRGTFLVKFDAAGAQAWARQLASQNANYPHAVAVGSDGVYVAGETQGALPGQVSAGLADGFVAKYDAAGTLLWVRQFGTPFQDSVRTVAAGPDGVYVAGETYGTLAGQTRAGGVKDAFVAKYDPAGILLWTRQFGSDSDDVALSAAAGSDGVYVGGYTEGALAGQTKTGYGDAFVTKYSPAGAALWIRQFGWGTHSLVSGATTGLDGVYLVGETLGTLPGQTSAGMSDGFVAKYDATGLRLWARQFGSGDEDYPHAVAAGPDGVYAAGETHGTFAGQTDADPEDADTFLVKYDPTGTLLSIRQFGWAAGELANGVAVGSDGVYLAGGVWQGALPGQTYLGGNADAFVVKLVPYGFAGFLPPLAPASDGSVVNTGKAGRVYPVRWQLRDASGGPVTRLSAVTSIQVQQVACGSLAGASDPVDADTAGSSGLRYDAAAGQYVYTWQTPTTPGCYVLRVGLDDGTSRSAAFSLS